MEAPKKVDIAAAVNHGLDDGLGFDGLKRLIAEPQAG